MISSVSSQHDSIFQRGKNTSMIFKVTEEEPTHAERVKGPRADGTGPGEGGGGVVLRHKAHTPAVNMDVTPIMSEGLAPEPQEGRPRVRP